MVCVYGAYQVTRDQMLEEMKYTLKVDHVSNPQLDAMLVTSPDPYEACKGAHAVAILTEWDEFKT